MDLKEMEEIRRIVRDETRREYNRLKENEMSRKERNTQEILKQYRNAVFHVKEITLDEKEKLRKNIAASGAFSHFVDDIECANVNTKIVVRNINKAIKEIEKRRVSEGRQQEYRAFQLYYLEGLTYENAKAKLEDETGEQLGKVTVKRWCDKILKELSVLLWGL